jgi:hypothetical protein
MFGAWVSSGQWSFLVHGYVSLPSLEELTAGVDKNKQHSLLDFEIKIWGAIM